MKKSLIKKAALRPKCLFRKWTLGVRDLFIPRYLRRQNRRKVDLRRSISFNGSLKLDTKRDAHIVTVDNQGSSASLLWTVPADCVLETHGHCVALYDSNQVRFAEALIESPGPVVVRAVTGRQGQAVSITTSGTANQINMIVRYGDFKLVDRGVAEADSGWEQWRGAERTVTYLLEQPETPEGRSRLVVVFSAIGADYDFTYNYRSSLSQADTYRLYILDDFGKRGSYYYSDNRDDGIYKSVQSFMKYILRALGILESSVTFAGSSKGGTAALIHGLPLGVANVIVGAPQFKPGTYLESSAPDILSFIAGDRGSTARKWLDDVVTSAITAQKSGTKISIIVGTSDHHYRAHALPLFALLQEKGMDAVLMVVRGVNHQEIGRPFGAYLKQMVTLWVHHPAVTSDSLLPYELSWKPGAVNNVAVLRLWVPEDEQVAVRAYARGRIVASFAHSDTETYSIGRPLGGPVRFRVYRRSLSTKRRLGVFTTNWLYSSSTADDTQMDSG